MPHPHRARFTLLAAGQPLYQTTKTFGFRTIEVRRGRGLFGRLFDFYGLSGPVPAPALPPGNFSSPGAIPPIGTKLAPNLGSHTRGPGPLGETNQAALPGARAAAAAASPAPLASPSPTECPPRTTCFSD